MFTADKWVVFQYLNQEYSMFIGVCILCAVVAFMLVCFILYHVYLIRRGTTTNEGSKQGQIGYVLNRQAEFYTKWEHVK